MVLLLYALLTTIAGTFVCLGISLSLLLQGYRTMKSLLALAVLISLASVTYADCANGTCGPRTFRRPSKVLVRYPSQLPAKPRLIFGR